MILYFLHKLISSLAHAATRFDKHLLDDEIVLRREARLALAPHNADEFFEIADIARPPLNVDVLPAGGVRRFGFGQAELDVRWFDGLENGAALQASTSTRRCGPGSISSDVPSIIAMAPASSYSNTMTPRSVPSGQYEVDRGFPAAPRDVVKIVADGRHL